MFTNSAKEKKNGLLNKKGASEREGAMKLVVCLMIRTASKKGISVWV